MKAGISLFVWIVVVTYFSLTPVSTEAMTLFPFQDKLGHFLFYFIMAMLAFRLRKVKNTQHVMMIILLTAAYGALMECLQLWMDLGRHFDYFDILANISGSLTGAAIYYFKRDHFRSHPS